MSPVPIGGPTAGPPSNLRCRSLLYTPADRPERYTKAWQSGAADIVCADLEDAVAPANKAAARQAVTAALRATPQAGGTTRRAVRINAWSTADAPADIVALAFCKPDLVVVPKVEDVTTVAAVRRALPGVGIVAILETPRGVLAAQAIAASGVAAVCFGAEDLAAEAGMRRSRDNLEVLAARQWVVLCARAAGVPAIDMISADFKDEARTTSEAKQARDWGFSGKMCIHPSQVEPIHAAFRPTADELAWARKVVQAASGIESGGVVVVDGKMVDVPVIRQAQRTLADA